MLIEREKFGIHVFSALIRRLGPGSGIVFMRIYLQLKFHRIDVAATRDWNTWTIEAEPERVSANPKKMKSKILRITV